MADIEHIKEARIYYVKNPNNERDFGRDIGMIAHNITTNEKYVCILEEKIDKEIPQYDSEVDINFIKTYLRGIENEVYSCDKFDLEEYAHTFNNNIRLGKTKTYTIDHLIGRR